MATKSKRHTHKYHRVNFKFARVWACALSDCLHYLPPHMEEVIEGKQSYCWGCGKLMLLDSEALKEDNPRCLECRTGVKAEEIEIALSPALKEFIEKGRTN